ncbi:epithelial-stromal interaction protein 1 [Discoglossus pictus]
MNRRGAGTGRAVGGRSLQNGNLNGPQRNNLYGDEWNQGMDQQQDPYSGQSTAGVGIQQPPVQSSRDPQYMGGYTLIPPNESRRNKLQTMANKELEEWDRWKEAQRPGPVNLNPKKLGGYGTEADVRQKQQAIQHQSKYQKMLQREEYKKKQREEEESKIQKMKDIQRQKAELLEEKRYQQDRQRQLQWQEDMYLRNNTFLDQMSQPAGNYQTHNSCGNSSTAWQKSQAYKQQQREEENIKIAQMKEEQRMKSELLELRQRQEEEDQQLSHRENQRRVNNAFLDRLQGQNAEPQYGHFENTYTWS